MIRVVIIDDEPVIRRGIRTMVSWKALGCEVCGDAPDGQSGLQMIKTLRPQIVLTDIRMPGMDGLDMVRRVRAILPDCRVIIMTGYRNFEYAQEAVRLGAFDLVTKPTKMEELVQIIRRATEEIASARRQDGSIVREKMLYNLIVGAGVDGMEHDEVRQQLRMDLTRYTLGMVETSRDAAAASGGEAASFPVHGMEIVRRELGVHFPACCIGFGAQSIVCVLPLPAGHSDWKEQVTADCRRIRSALEENPDDISIAFSEEGKGAPSLPAKLQECRDALEYTFLFDRQPVVFYGSLQASHIRDDCAYLREWQSRLIAHIRAGNRQSAAADGRDIAARIRNAPHLDGQFVHNYYFDTILRIYALRQQPGQNSEEGLAGLRGLIDRCDNLEDLNGLIEKTARQETVFARQTDHAPGPLLRRAQEYIAAHYREDLTLGGVAKAIYVSPCYASHMFRKELNVNFVDYLNNLRIQRARDMLADPHYKIYEVAEAVGIPNEHYFSQLFKRYIGVTATEYRQGAE